MGLVLDCKGGAIGKTGKSEKGKREEGTRRGGRPGRDSQVKVETPSCQRRRSRGRDVAVDAGR